MVAPLLAVLGDDLVIRRATPADAEALAAFNADVHRRADDAPPDEAIGAWTYDLLTRPHPTTGPDDFTVVEDRRTGAIVSSTVLISQTWSYDGIPFGLGRPELVGTHPDYRRRGLIRRQMELLHAWSAERGELVQAITGIPWYYRQFGYEYALVLGGGRAGYLPSLPKPTEGEEDRFRVRPATPADVPFLRAVDEHARRRSLVTCVRDEALWRHLVDAWSGTSPHRGALQVVETRDGKRVGYLARQGGLQEGKLWVAAFELAPGVSWLAVAPAVLRHLRAAGAALRRPDGPEPFDGVGFWLGADHPAYRALADHLPRARRPYAFYLRVPDLPAFARRIAPVLEARLAGSPAAGHSGQLHVGFYADGLRLTFDEGRLVTAESWPDPARPKSGASFPALTFLQLLFGYRSLEELEHAFPDCAVRTDEARTLLEAFFPKKPSEVWPVF